MENIMLQIHGNICVGVDLIEPWVQKLLSDVWLTHFALLEIIIQHKADLKNRNQAV